MLTTPTFAGSGVTGGGGGGGGAINVTVKVENAYGVKDLENQVTVGVAKAISEAFVEEATNHRRGQGGR